MNPYRELFQAMNDAGIRYLVVGGVAVNLHGYVRFTGDIDLLLALEEKNLENMTEVMRALGYTERLPVTLKALADEKQVQRWLDEKNMTAFAFISNENPLFSVDVLAGHSLRFKDFDRRKVMKRSEAIGAEVPVVSIDDLVGMKREANRPKDLLDIDALLELKGYEMESDKDGH